MIFGSPFAGSQGIGGKARFFDITDCEDLVITGPAGLIGLDPGCPADGDTFPPNPAEN